MRIINLRTKTGTCRVEIGVPMAGIEDALHGRRAVAIIDSRVRELHGDRLFPLPSIDIAASESGKTLRVVEGIYDRLIDLDVDRATAVVAIGGGVTLDIAGFAASTFLRGLPFLSVPTTLLAQADAAVGGKNGVNHRGYKNMAGVFAQPERVICDHSVLFTLCAADRRNGLIEIVKHAVISDARLFSLLESNASPVMDLEPAFAEEAVFASLAVKTAIVRRDEKEGGLRRKLNLGHTLGHALEKVFHIPHGDAVGMGLAFAARFANRLGRLSDTSTDRILALLDALGTPGAPSGRKEALKEALARDKKRDGSKVHFILPEDIGRCTVEEIPLRQLEEAVDDLC